MRQYLQTLRGKIPRTTASNILHLLEAIEDEENDSDNKNHDHMGNDNKENSVHNNKKNTSINTIPDNNKGVVRNIQTISLEYKRF